MSPFFEDPAIYRSVLENLPIGIYVLDREQRVRFWNRGAEQITGYFAHEVIGHSCSESLPHCDPQGRVLSGDRCSITTTFHDGRVLQNHVFTLHKHGHRLGVKVRTLPIHNDGLIVGVAVAFEEAAEDSVVERAGALIYGCLDPLTGVPSQRLTRAMWTESLAALEDAHGGFGLLRIRITGLDEFSARYGANSIAAFLRTLAPNNSSQFEHRRFSRTLGQKRVLGNAAVVKPHQSRSHGGTHLGCNSANLKSLGGETAFP